MSSPTPGTAHLRIADLFDRPIGRGINGVIKAGQQDDRNVEQELDEYVVTRELDGQFRRFFEHYADSLEKPTDRVGVWISGFFGSGKSHFLKILSYLLANREVMGRRALSFFDESKLPDAVLRAWVDKAARAAEHTDVILFNIDAKADASSKANKEAVARVMQKAFDEHLGYLASSPEMAALERMLDKRGKYGEFKVAFEGAAGAPWTEVRDGWAFHQPDIIQALTQAAGMTPDEGQRWLESLSVQRDPSAEEFAREVRDYLDRRGKGHRVLFLVDEVGQYVGDNSSLMLNLQSVAEELGTRAPGRAWILVTSQEDIDRVLQGKGKSNDFSKIQGRFTTRISLSSANTDEVIRLRLLKKTADGARALEALYDTSQAALKNLITFNNDATLLGYKDAESFVANYPFIPYQFKLLQEAFTAIRQTGHSGKHLSEGERSMLNAFQDAAQTYGGQPLGSLVPFWAFYSAVEGFLDSNVRRVIDQAKDNPALEAQDTEVLKTLFMLKHVKEIKTNLDNLTTLSLRQVDEDRLALRGRIQASLARLEKQTLIARSGDLWTFLTNEEQDVGREIKSIDVAEGELNAELQKRVWQSVFTATSLKYDTYHQYPFNRKLDDRPFGAAAHDIGVQIVTPFAERFEALAEEHVAAVQSGTVLPGGSIEALVILPDDRLLFEELTEMVRTDRYVARKSGQDSTPSMRQIVSARAEENNARKARIETNLRQAIAGARVYVLGSRLESPGGSAAEVLQGALRALVNNGYPKRSFLQKPHLTEGDVARAFITPDDSQNLDGQDPNHLALGEMERWLSEQGLRNVRVTVRTLLDQFTRRPYGWTDAEVLGILATLVARGQVDLHRAQKLVDPGEPGLAGRLLKKAGQEDTVVRLSDAIDPKALGIARRLARDYLTQVDRPSTADAPKLAAAYREQLAQDREALLRYQDRAGQGYPFGPALTAPLAAVDALLATSGTAALFAEIGTWEEALEDWTDLRAKLQSFYGGAQVKIFDEVRRDLADLESDLPRVTVPELQDRIGKARDMLALPDPVKVIPQLSGLLKPVKAHVEELLAESKIRVQAVLEDEVARLQAIAGELGPEATRKLTGPILEVRGRLEAARTIDAVESTQIAVQNAATRTEQDILRAINERARQVTPQPAGDQPGGGETAQPTLKPIRTLKVRSITAAPYLESTQDIDAFLEVLRTQLEQALQNGERIRIE
ncbi:BREX system P-loop protein BrxC [Deinococcus sp. MIMF12]|uniref:BREX system P-loop protein BrxC n=1 Tax=Deinococcus rhizophilus TaxID=3049544 RepID=A0ABT7JGN7_9DEIO|nr:BREX system P-loop protein BrxC [Deinococcus rhizophilus]MDL2342844.1 BREX system P-loop protein BrxC [Deinococcus rhizophilus]